MAGLFAPFLAAAGQTAATAAPAVAGTGMADILAQAAAAPVVGAAPSIAKGIAPAAPFSSKSFMDYLNTGVRLGNLAGLGGESTAPNVASAAPATVPAQPQAPAPQMPVYQTQPYQPTAVSLLDLFRRR